MNILFFKNLFDRLVILNSSINSCLWNIQISRPFFNGHCFILKSKVFAFFKRCFKYIFYFPFSSEPIINDIARKFKIFCPLRYCLRFVIKFKNYIISSIVALLFHSSPFAIFRNVISVIINAFNRVFRSWSFPHVFKEILKRIQPTLTNLNTSSPIICKRIIVGIKNSHFHRNPSMIFGGMFHSMRFYSAKIIASTTHLRSCAECKCSNNTNIATIAETLPKNIAMFIFTKLFFYNQKVKTSIEEIGTFGHFMFLNFKYNNIALNLH